MLAQCCATPQWGQRRHPRRCRAQPQGVFNVTSRRHGGRALVAFSVCGNAQGWHVRDRHRGWGNDGTLAVTVRNPRDHSTSQAHGMVIGQGWHSVSVATAQRWCCAPRRRGHRRYPRSGKAQRWHVRGRRRGRRRYPRCCKAPPSGWTMLLLLAE